MGFALRVWILAFAGMRGVGSVTTDTNSGSAEVHRVLKRDLAGGRLPSGKFGENAAWWAVVVLSFNLNSIMKWLVWGWDVAPQAVEGHPVRPRGAGGSGGAARSPVDHLPSPRPSLVPGAAAGAGEDTGTGRHTLSRIALTEPTLTGGKRLRRVARDMTCLVRPPHAPRSSETRTKRR